MQLENIQTEIVVIGSGPGGYTAAFRAADLGQKVVLVEKYASLGGVCLNVGCIPSKALLHTALILDETKGMGEQGIEFAKPKIDAQKLKTWKDGVVKKLTGGLTMLAKQRQVTVIQGTAAFSGPNSITIKTAGGQQDVHFKQAIIAAGSESVTFPFIPEDKRIFSSTGALELRDIKGSLMVLGGGIIGLEMATVYRALGAQVTVVEFMDQLIPSADSDLVNVLQKKMSKNGIEFLLKTKATKIEAKTDGLYVTLEGAHATDKPRKFDQILVAVGRRPNGDKIAADKAGVQVDEKGFIHVDNQMRTNVPHIFAIGDLVGQPMLAHKSVAQGKVAAEVASGMKHYFDPKTIPSVAYTDPELAWAGINEKEAKAQNIPYEKAVFPWAANGRALSMHREEGLTKLLFCPNTKRIIGAGIVGMNAGDLIAETVLAIEMECDVEDIALSIHPHPTLSETVAQAAEIFAGSITDLYIPKKKG